MKIFQNTLGVTNFSFGENLFLFGVSSSFVSYFSPSLRTVSPLGSDCESEAFGLVANIIPKVVP